MCYETLKIIILFAKEYDIPNWFVFIFTVFFWPLVLFLWNARKTQSIPNLEVSLSEAKLNIWKMIDSKRVDTEYAALWFKFSNQTGSTVYISNARLLKCTKLLNVAKASTRDLSAAYELNFQVDNNLNQRQVILHTNCKTETAIALDSNPSLSIMQYKPSILRRIFRYPKYFCLEYVAMVGKKRYNVSTIY